MREEAFALPPRGLLASLANGAVEPGMAGVLALADELETALPGMLAEHKELVAARGDLEAAANAENKPQYARFAGKLIQHARTEEEILYSAALLIGRYVRLSLGAGESVNNLSPQE